MRKLKKTIDTNKSSKLKNIPKFKNAIEEKIFWEKNDSADFIDWKKAKRATFPNLKPSVKVISLRLPEDLLNQIKVLANKEDVPYQSLMKILLVRAVKDFRK